MRILVILSHFNVVLKINHFYLLFSCQILDLNIRGIKDGGCQSNFVTDYIATKLKLKIIEENIKINIQGINDSWDYYTKLDWISG